MENIKNILEIKDFSVEYRTDTGIVKALNGLDLSIAVGETHGLVGETGAGKTTTGLGILKLIPDPPGKVVKGSIQLEGVDLATQSEKKMEKIRGKVATMIFQDPMTSLNPVMTVEDQIAEVLELHENYGHKKALEETHKMLELVGIPAERGKEFPHQFSGGMKQRVVIAIALAGNPKLLIADEPTTALDVTIQAQVLEMMKKLKVQYNTSMLMITHDLGIVAEICDKVSVIYAGRIVEQGLLEDVFEHTRHPYTEGLFNSLPNIEDRQDMLKPIKGLMPDPMDLPPGCPFHPRCDYAMDICKQKAPSRTYRNDNHYIECHLYDEKNVIEGKVIQRD